MASFIDIPIDHRAYPPPDDPWSMTMAWHDLLFAHWPVPVDAIRSHIPFGLDVDTFDGRAWIGVVPFRMTRVGPPELNRLPWLSSFAELNVRTYVIGCGRPGIWFFSLDAANALAVAVARRAYHLPYYRAAIEIAPGAEAIHYRSRRTHPGAPAARLDMSYQPTDDAMVAARGSFEHWFAERYSLFAADRRGRIHLGDVHHGPWPLQPAEARFADNTMTDQIGVALPDQKPLLHFARRLDVVAWPLRPVATSTART